MNKTVIGVLVVLIVVVGGGVAIYKNAVSNDADTTMMKEDQAMKPATTSADAMMKDDADTMMASGTPTMMDDEKRGDTMMPR